VIEDIEEIWYSWYHDTKTGRPSQLRQAGPVMTVGHFRVQQHPGMRIAEQPVSTANQQQPTTFGALPVDLTLHIPALTRPVDNST